MTDVARGFGDSSAYYAAGPTHEDQQSRRQRERVKTILDGHAPDAKDRVEHAYRQWNGILRDALRAEMALRLTVGDDQQAVPVRIADGLPEPLVTLFAEIPDSALWLSLNRGVFDQTSLGLDLLMGGLISGELERWLSSVAATEIELEHTKQMVADVLARLGHEDVIGRIGGLDRDVLGAYFLHLPEIRLYWMAIALVAGMLALPVEALTVVVLTHELAHAYSHLGRDIDGRRWETVVFAKTELPVAEGLAQFYTAAVCAKMAARFPGVGVAFGALLERQSGPYRVHEGWARDDGSPGEVVRIAMIATRLKQITSYQGFEQELLAAAARVRRPGGGSS
jgi:hypothetical protein